MNELELKVKKAKDEFKKNESGEETLAPADETKLQGQVDGLLAEVNAELSKARGQSPMLAEAIQAVEAMDIPADKKAELIRQLKGEEKVIEGGSAEVKEEIKSPEGKDETKEEKTDAEKEAEKIGKELVLARNTYVNVFTAYNTEKSTWEKWMHKTRMAAVGVQNYFKGVEGKKYIEEKHPNSEDLALATVKYDSARMALLENQTSSKVDELKLLNLGNNEMEAKVKEFRIEKRLQLQMGETASINNARAEKLPERKKNALQKALSKTMGAVNYAKDAGLGLVSFYQKLGEWGPEIKIPIGKEPDGSTKYYGYKTGKLVRSAAIALVGAGGGMGAAWLGLRLMRGIAVSTGTAAALNKMDKNYSAKTAGFQSEREALDKAYGEGSLNLSDYEKRIATIEQAEKKSKRRNDLGRLVVAGLAVGASWGGSKGEHAWHDSLNTGNASDQAGNILEKTPHQEEVPPSPKDPLLMPKDATGVAPHVPPHPGSHPEANPPKPEHQTDSPETKAPIIPKEAIIGEGNVSITHAFKMQLEADPKLAHELGYDSAPDKKLFLKHLAEQLGYIGKNGESLGVKADMGEAFVLNSVANPDGTFAAASSEYQNGVLTEEHHSGDSFEDREHQEKYEYTRPDDAAHNEAVEKEAVSVDAKDNDFLHEEGSDKTDLSGKNETNPISIENTERFAEENNNLMSQVFGYREGIFGQKAINIEEWKNSKDIPMGLIIGNNDGSRTELASRLQELVRNTRIPFNTEESVEDYMKRIAIIRAQEER